MAVVSNAESIFSSRGFRQYFIGQSLSMLGDGFRTLAIPLLAYKLTGSALATGTALFCEFLPFSLFALVGGSLADRLDRRALMIGADAVRCVVLLFFALAFARGFLTLPMIYAGLVVISVCAAVFLGGQSPSLPYLLGRERVTEATAALTAAESTTNTLMPVIGASIFASFGPLPALLINAFTYLGSQLSLSRIETLGPDEPHGLPTFAHILDDVRVGFRVLFGDRGLRAQAIMAFGLNTFGLGGYSILIPFLKHGYDATDQQVGIFLSIIAVGALGGALFAGRTANRWPFGRALSIAYAIDALCFVPVVAVHNFWVAAICWSASSACGLFQFAQIVGFRIRVTPDGYVGRLMGAVRLFVIGGPAFAIPVFGWIADRHGPYTAMWLSAVGFLVIAVSALAIPAIRDETR